MPAETDDPLREMKKRTKILLVVFGVGGLIGLAGIVVGVLTFMRSGITQPLDNLFGDQHLKTTVALVELHKLRNGRYPSTLSDLRFTGEWDQIALSSVVYCTNNDQSKYFIEVQRGWVAHPELKMPAEFWQGTGFDPGIGPCK